MAGAGAALLAVVAIIWILAGNRGDVPAKLAARPSAAAESPAADGHRPKPAVRSADPHRAEPPAGPRTTEPTSEDEKPVDLASDALHRDEPSVAAARGDAPEAEAPVSESEFVAGTAPPDAQAVQAAVADIQSLLKTEYGAAKKVDQKVALAEKLLALVPDSSDASERYALLSEARRLAIAAGNPALAFQAADALGEIFTIDLYELLVKTAEELGAKELSSAARKELAEAIVPLVQAAFDARQFTAGRRLAAVGVAAARKTNQAETAKSLARLGKESAAAEKLAASAADARTQLEANPDDSPANETLGKYLCLYSRDWPAGLPHLARAKDFAWRCGRVGNVGRPCRDAAVKTGDAWWDLAEHGGTDAGRMRARAGYWYREALDSLSGLAKTRVEKRLQEIAASQPGGDLQPGNADGGVIADKVVVWNCHNNTSKDRGMLSCNVELRRANKVVWSKKGIKLAWSRDDEPATTIPLPKMPFDALRVASDTFEDSGPALCEVEIFRGDTNIARGKPVAASGFYYPPTYLPAAVVDGIRDSSQRHVGYWLAPDRQPGWVEVQVAPPGAPAARSSICWIFPQSRNEFMSPSSYRTRPPLGAWRAPARCSCMRCPLAPPRRPLRWTKNIRHLLALPRSAIWLAREASRR